MIDFIKELQSTRANKEDIEYNLFDCENGYRDKFIQIMSDVLSMLRNLFIEDFGIKEEVIDNHIIQTFNRISSIRIDEKNKEIPPISIMIEDFTQGGTIPFNSKSNDGTTRAVKRDGIMLLIPDLKTRFLEKNKQSLVKGIHTFIHEFIHAMSVFEKDNEFFTGLQVNREDKILDELNEGMTEYITYQIMKRLFIGFEIDERYSFRKKLIEQILNNEDKGNRLKIINSFIVGKGDKVLNYFSSHLNSAGKNMVDYLSEEYNKLLEIKNPNEIEVNFNKVLNNLKSFNNRKELSL